MKNLTYPAMRNEFAWAIITFAYAFTPQLQASTVTNTECTLTANGSTVTTSGPASCQVQLATSTGSVGSASASITVTPMLLTGLSIAGQVIAFPAPGDIGETSTGGATATGTYQIWLTTPGPVRPGIIEYNLFGGGLFAPDSPTATSTISIGNLTSTCSASGLFGDLNCAGPLQPTNPPARGTLAFTLGQPFLFSGNFLLQAVSDQPGSNIESGQFQIGFDFTLRDDSGAPVEVTAIPEPATMSLIAGALFVAGLLSVRRSGATRR